MCATADLLCGTRSHSLITPGCADRDRRPQASAQAQNARRASQNQQALIQALNLAWVLVAGFLVMFMQVGFAMLETGFTRAKNAVNTMAMNLIIYPLGVARILADRLWADDGRRGALAFAGQRSDRRITSSRSILGAIAYGLIGASKFALLNVSHDPASLAMFLFSVVFMDTAATIPTGAMAERWKFSAFLIYGLFMSMFLYPLYGNWVWGGGWLVATRAQSRPGTRPR